MKLGDIKGIGSKKIELLKELNICSIDDLINYIPIRYEDRSKFTTVSKASPQIKSAYRLRIKSQAKTYYYKKNMSITRLQAADDTGQMNIIWYNDRFSARNLKLGQEYNFFGTFNDEKKALINPKVANIDSEEIGGIIPIYSGLKGLSSKQVSKFITNLLESDYLFEDYLDKDFLDSNKIYNLEQMYKAIHKPASYPDLYQAYYSKNFRDIYLDKLSYRIHRENLNKDYIAFTKPDKYDLETKLSFRFTVSQRKAIQEIKSDMKANKRMNRLLIGDVGSGKTAVAIDAALLAISNGYQVAFMAPTEILAIQHYDKYCSLLKSMGINSSLLLGSTKKNDRREILTGLNDGQSQIIFGTHSLFQKGVDFFNLGLVITDEQQRFGVAQRKALADKGYKPDILLLSATPIPRTLALTLYDYLDLTFLEGLPSNRKPIKSYLTSIYQEKDFIDFAIRQIENKRQVYIVASRVEDDENLESIHRLEEKLKKYLPKNKRIGVLYGSMDASSKEDVQKRFAKGQIDLLIATSIIEVGIDVPNANTMIIYDANQFGLSQLHQIRGRVGRSDIQSYCFFVVNEKYTENEKLEFMVESLDGFEIAKKDLELRGKGDMYGRSQSGFIEIDSAFILNENLLNLVNKLLEETKEINTSLTSIIGERLSKLEGVIMN